MEDDLPADIFFHSAIGDRVCQRDDSVFVCVMVAVFVLQFCSQDRLQGVFNIAQHDHLFIRVDREAVGKHFSAPVILSLNFFDDVISVGQGSH